jgi:hypothetical protein
MLAARFGFSDEARTSKTALLLELEQLLYARRDAGESTVLVVDEAQSLPLDLLEEIRLLANIETNDEKLLTVIIAGQPELTQRLNNPALRQLKQRVALRCELRALTAQETAAYLAGRIRAAGGVGAQVFTREAVTLIHERSHGIPRLISVIADNALVTGFALGQRPVTSATVREVCRDFDLAAPAPTGQVVSQDAPPVDEPAADAGRMIAFEPSSKLEEIAPEQHAPPVRSTAAVVAPVDPPEETRGVVLDVVNATRRRFSFF